MSEKSWPPTANPAAGQSAARLPLCRPQANDGATRSQGRILAGVAAGLAAHLRINPWIMRAIFVLSSPFIGVGILLYLWFWVFVPPGNPWAHQAWPVDESRLAEPLRLAHSTRKSEKNPYLAIMPVVLLALGLIVLAIVGAWEGPEALTRGRPAMVAILVMGGVSMIWAGASKQDGSRLELSRFLLLAGPGVIAVVLGVMVWVGGTLSWKDALKGGAMTLVVIALLSLAGLPLWARFWNDFKTSLAEQTRQTLRADMAAHLHDSVLQTLALIRARAHNPAEVAQLARAEERQLRAWLYEDRPDVSQSLVQVIKDIIGEIEDRYGVVFETVTVGDAPPGAWSDSLVAATREALNNAAQHAAPAFSVYLEIGADTANCFVRDHGTGFQVDDIPEGHHGVKESIIERLERHGGHAKIRSNENGTEVQMEVKRQ